ncbi:hypothetical protein ACSW8Q_17220 (plasmid) [Clostridium perfringens]|uniref:hypothetical protein n=1 Tax=Clostridium perfringens TaxID=1502 RepID=UPI0024BD015C|nr:hypothetical protein [Clostridium perfringens]MDK0554470.1 hypothetical protein [Clostridium perfringens]MDT7989088.1 hypothetical protein [Clostridium perfringens]WVM62284.1 hypothetical protein V1657_16255 [Clostridium perfringens]
MEKFAMFVIGIYILNLDHWTSKFVRNGIYGLMLIDLIRNLREFNLVNILMIFTGIFILNLPNIIKFYFRKKFYYR